MFARAGVHFCFGLLAGLLFASEASATQMVQCTAIPANARLKVLLDDVRGTDAVANAARDVLADLGGVLDLQLSAASLNQGLCFVRCSARFPEQEADFVTSEVVKLNQKNVLIEIWTTTRSGATGTGAVLSCALIPVLRYGTVADNVPNIYRLPPLPAPTHDAAEVLPAQHVDTLLGFALISAGLKDLNDEQDFDSAVENFCQGIVLLTRGGEPAPTAPTGRLVRYARDQMTRAFTEARNDAHYEGLLKEPDAGQNSACQGGR